MVLPDVLPGDVVGGGGGGHPGPPGGGGGGVHRLQPVLPEVEGEGVSRLSLLHSRLDLNIGEITETYFTLRICTSVAWCPGTVRSPSTNPTWPGTVPSPASR